MKLKPCPFCGCEPELVTDEPHWFEKYMLGFKTTYYVECKNGDCGVYCNGVPQQLSGDAILEWNTRLL